MHRKCSTCHSINTVMVPYNSIRGERQISHYHHCGKPLYHQCVETQSSEPYSVFYRMLGVICFFIVMHYGVYLSRVVVRGAHWGLSFSLGPGEKGTTHKNVIPGPVTLRSSSKSTTPSLFPLSRHQWLWSINTVLCQYATLSPLCGSADSWTLHPIIMLNWVQLFIDMTCKSVLLSYCMTEPDIGHQIWSLKILSDL